MYCGATDSRVIDSRPTDEGERIRRRRECLKCGKRFTTYECEKRPVAMHDVDQLVRDVETQIYNSLDQEVSSARIGEMVMERLRGLDEVAYVRFASVYRSFCDINTFMEELKKLLGKPGAEENEKTETDPESGSHNI